jgi:hypothetical protein
VDVPARVPLIATTASDSQHFPRFGVNGLLEHNAALVKQAM